MRPRSTRLPAAAPVWRTRKPQSAGYASGSWLQIREAKRAGFERPTVLGRPRRAAEDTDQGRDADPRIGIGGTRGLLRLGAADFESCPKLPIRWKSRGPRENILQAPGFGRIRREIRS